MFWKRKPIVEKYEEEFKTDKLRDKRIFYDLNIRVGDPEEFRVYANELLEDLDYKVNINKMVKFEDVEFEDFFQGGRLKPLKCIIRARKEIKKGPKYPLLWKLFAVSGLAFLLLYFIPKEFLPSGVLNSTAIITASSILLISAVLTYMIKKVVPLMIWIKAVGIYDVENTKADIKTIIASDVLYEDKESFTKLQDEVAEFYNVIAKKYIRKVPEKEKIVIVKKEEEPELKVLKKIKEVENEMSALDRSLIEGKMSEETYREIKNRLERRKEKLETIFDLISVA